jgi:hypothetical protein
VSLSDEILRRPGSIAPIRRLLSDLVSRLGARSAFLVDEAGSPFGAFGNVEFPLPHPLSLLTGQEGGAPLLEALLGEAKEDHSPALVVRRVGSRALLAVVLHQPLVGRPRRAALAEVDSLVARLIPLLEDSLNSDSPRT